MSSHTQQRDLLITPDGYFKCRDCPLRSQYWKEIFNHMVGVHEHDKKKKWCGYTKPGMSTCTGAGKNPNSNLSKFNMETHIRTHTGEKIHVCIYCGKGHADRSHKNKHENRCRKKQRDNLVSYPPSLPTQIAQRSNPLAITAEPVIPLASNHEALLSACFQLQDNISTFDSDTFAASMGITPFTFEPTLTSTCPPQAQIDKWDHFPTANSAYKYPTFPQAQAAPNIFYPQPQDYPTYPQSPLQNLNMNQMTSLYSLNYVTPSINHPWSHFQNDSHSSSSTDDSLFF